MTLERYAVSEILSLPTEGMTGRRKIKTSVKEITIDNVKEVFQKALAVHAMNAAEITYLWEYYKGSQDVRFKKKYVRENINNKVTVNIANEIVTFKTSYLLNEPISYISHGSDDSITDKVNRLNEFMRSENKQSHDKQIVDWMHICGLAERLVLPDEKVGVKDGAPYTVYTLDPRYAFVIYSSRIGEKPMAGVILQRDEKDQMFATIYTDKKVFEITRKDGAREIPNTEFGDVDEHIMGGIPLVEYENNMARMGAFEPVLSILNTINQLESDAVDSIQDYVNGFDVFQNCDIEDGDYSQLSIGGKAVRVKTVVQGMEAKVYRVSSEINQSGVQQRVDDLTEDYLMICGMPNRNGGSSTSDTGQAVIFRDGWSEAESRAKDTEKLYEKAERQFLQIVLNICNAYSDGDKSLGGLELKDIGVNFARKSLNNLQSRFQCLTEGLNNDRLAPKLLFDAFGDIFGDKMDAYRQSMEWREEMEKKQEEQIQNELDLERERIANAEAEKENAGAVPNRGRGNRETEQADSERDRADEA